MDTINLSDVSKKAYYNNELFNESFLTSNYYDNWILQNKTGKHYSFLCRKLTKESLISVNDNDINLTVDPLFDFNIKHSIGIVSKNYFQNTRGLLVKGTIAKNLYFETTYYESQGSSVTYIDDFIKKYAVFPGQQRVKNFKTSSYDYGLASGLLSYSPFAAKSKNNFNLNIQFGHGKNFFGDGYRSLLLSDFSAPYLFAKIISSYKNLKYTCLFTSFQNIFEGNVLPYKNVEWNAGYQKKTGTFHYLTYNAGNSFRISLFEATLWNVADSGGKHFNVDFFNPLILVHTAEFGLNNKNNTLLGLNVLYKAFDKIHFYAQLVADDIRIKKISTKGYFHNRSGIQAGAEGFDLFGIKNLNVQAEYNQASPYMYSSESPTQSYTHYNQALAHPLGANFREGVGILRYSFKKVFIHAQINLAAYGADTAKSDFGKNIFLSDMNATASVNSSRNKIGQGINTNLKYANFCVSYLLNPVTNLNVFIGATYRNEKNIFKNQSDKFIYAGIRTSLKNEYFDF
ncbi:MAG: hypothetical protein HGB12_09720 [Bacteroidetes bacterium]|nr:hypothetical protein [Bacteroidota bacterium]